MRLLDKFPGGHQTYCASQSPIVLVLVFFWQTNTATQSTAFNVSALRKPSIHQPRSKIEDENENEDDRGMGDKTEAGLVRICSSLHLTMEFRPNPRLHTEQQRLKTDRPEQAQHRPPPLSF